MIDEFPPKEWYEKEQPAYSGVPIKVEHPPCSGCEFWAPRSTRGFDKEIRITLCHRDEMQQDFSCYRTRYVEESGDDAL